MILGEITKFWSNLAWFGPSETWNHIKFYEIRFGFNNRDPFENDCRPGIRYDSIACIHSCLFPCVRSTPRSGGRDDVESLKISHFFFDPHRPE